MRYLGNKTNLLDFIDDVIKKYNIQGETFADLFAGTCSVGDYFKDKYTIIANDYMYFSSCICKAKLMNSTIPKFELFQNAKKQDVFIYLNEMNFTDIDDGFILNNYSPVGNRMYFTEDNAKKIDSIRYEIERLYNESLLRENEYYFLIASLLESVLKVSNTTGTYQAFLKFWESRSLKKFTLEPLEINDTNPVGKSEVYCEDTNLLVRKIEGDIAYIDTPYTITQYTNSYHVLETIARCDSPEIFGKTGRRKERALSEYSNKYKAIEAFEDLLRQLKFSHVLISYSDQAIIPIDDLVDLAKKFAKNGIVNVEYYEYREYATNNLSYKGNGKKLHEVIIYFEKDYKINKSPLNYSGSKDDVLPTIITYLPKHIGTFVDAMGGAFNVGANIVATDSVIYNEFNKYVFEIMKYLLQTKKETIILNTEKLVKDFDLHKKDKEAYLKLRDYYNETKLPEVLFTLQIYAFQNMIRFNSSQKMNTPVGNNEYNPGTKERIQSFRVKSINYKLINDSYENLDFKSLPSDTLFYFDPPYFITKAEYNDGKRGLEGWNIDKEERLLNYLKMLDENGYKFMLSNVILHKGKEHTLLLNWVKDNGYNIHVIGRTGIKYPREEVVVTNYIE